MMAWGWLGAAALLTVLWAIHLRSRDAGISDFGWAASLGGLAIFYALELEQGWGPRRVLVAALAGVWSARLSAYLLLDRVLPPGEDGRWGALRERWGDGAPIAFFFVFQLQAALAVFLSGAYLLAMRAPESGLRTWDVLGTLIVLGAVAGESIADRQLARWRADPANRGRTCRTGLWRWSRHPNYFFEWLHWWAWPILAVGAPWGWAATYAPLFMLAFILWISGIPATERRALATRGDDYRRYQRTTSAFFPRPPRESPTP
jgi:steroid 5-alpha reductase family enzyme